ncbi:MAG: class I SAM-dependent methyltransferase [Cyclobacteriaceae bacterium]
MKGAIKSLTVDRYLSPIRDQLIGMVDPGAKVIEFGCGNGDLLCRMAQKIEIGTGIDSSVPLIDYANKKKQSQDFSNINFEVKDLCLGYSSEKKYDFAIASLLLHVLPMNCSLELLNKMISISDAVLICEFSKPENLKQHFLLWLDQRFTPHYKHFKAFKSSNYSEGIFERISNITVTTHDTFDPVIKIYEVVSKGS